MSVKRIYFDEINIDIKLVKNLLSQQFSEWKNLNLELIKPEGTDNVMYRLGDDKVVRLPRNQISSLNIEKEINILPILKPHISISIPEVLAVGKSDESYPFPWLICSQLEGKNLDDKDEVDLNQAAIDLGNLVRSMQNINSKNGITCKRGESISSRDNAVRKAIALSGRFFDTKLLTKLWNNVLKASEWKGDPVWIHGDLHPGNLLAQDGKISGIVDFSFSGIGDPAVDLMVAWTLFTKETREIFRAIVRPDDATWERARGWALFLGVLGYYYYVESNPAFAAIAKKSLDEVIIDHQN
ncbi:phosphotransferase [Candidatus Dependentiae bacterium]|nr:MAG: phosphotransferase [Candidatus Dependentiae bacterium]